MDLIIPIEINEAYPCCKYHSSSGLLLLLVFIIIIISSSSSSSSSASSNSRCSSKELTKSMFYIGYNTFFKYDPEISRCH
jgi:hypothetical protein